MCSPSDAMKSLNNTVQQFTQQVTSEAGTVFGAANTVFNNIMNAVGGIVKAGASQLGFSTGELNAKNAAVVQGGATEARNLEAAAASGAAAIGGGNVALPGGATAAAKQTAAIQAASDTATAENQITEADWETGRQNFWAGIGAEGKAPGVYDVANSFNKTAGQQQQEAMKSQQNIDTGDNWWKSLLVNTATSLAQGPSIPGMGGSPTTGNIQNPMQPGGMPGYVSPGDQTPPDMTGQYGPVGSGPDLGIGNGPMPTMAPAP